MNRKANVLVVFLVFLVAGYAQAQRGVRIAYVDMEYILENVEEYRDASEWLESKVQKWKLEVEQERNQVEQMRKDLMAERVLLTDELIAEREEEIQFLEKEVFQYQQDRFGPAGDLVQQKRQLIQPIQDQVFNEVQKLGNNKKYDFIFDKSADVVMLYSQKRHDISEQVLRAISRTRKLSAPKKKKPKKPKGSNAYEAPNEMVLERQEKAKAAQEARAKTADERRKEQLKLREERKKAYEARRAKLLEEREARKKDKEGKVTTTSEEEKTNEEGEGQGATQQE